MRKGSSTSFQVKIFACYCFFFFFKMTSLIGKPFCYTGDSSIKIPLCLAINQHSRIIFTLLTSSNSHSRIFLHFSNRNDIATSSITPRATNSIQNFYKRTQQSPMQIFSCDFSFNSPLMSE